MLCYEEEFQVMWSRNLCTVANLLKAWFKDFLLLSACHFAKFDTSIICHVLRISFGSF